MSNREIIFPKSKKNPKEILQTMQDIRANDGNWQEGRVWSLVYYPGEEAYKLLQDAFNLFFSENALNPTTFPSLRKFENEVAAMTTHLLNGDENCVASMTSGGTESIMSALKSARDYAAEKFPHITNPEVVIPNSAHPAFMKAAHYLKLKLVVVPVEKDFRVSVEKMKFSINKNTILLVASAPSYPQGVMDPIEEIGNLALDNKLLFHVDSCIGGFMLPFLEKLGEKIPKFDFRVKGVTSMSADVHKYGYSSKGGSVIVYRNKELRRKQFYVYSEWPGGIYGSPAILGTRSGGSIAAAWAMINHLGEEGYINLAKETLNATHKLMEGIRQIPELFILGNPIMTIFSFGSDEIDIYAVGDEMAIKGWYLDRQQYPANLHLSVHYGHIPYIDKFLEDLTQCVAIVKKSKIRSVSRQFIRFMVRGMAKTLPENWVSKIAAFGNSISSGSTIPKRSAAMYGMMGELPNRNDVHELVLDFLDKLQTPDFKNSQDIH